VIKDLVGGESSFPKRRKVAERSASFVRTHGSLLGTFSPQTSLVFYGLFH
jgi:hypothetical protein